MSFRVLCCAVLATCLFQTSSFGTDIIVPDIQPTVAAAIEAAKLGDVIRIRSGRYEGDLFINKGITLRAAGDGDVVIIASPKKNDGSIAIKSMEPVMLDGLIFENTVVEEKLSKSSLVLIQGVCAVKNCTFRKANGVGCKVMPCSEAKGNTPKTNVTFSDCVFSQNGTTGVLVFRTPEGELDSLGVMAPDSDPALLAEAALTDCTFSRNASSGAQVDGLGTKGIFTECTLEQNGGRGLLFSRRSAGSATRCVSRENKKSGIVAWQTLKDGIHISGCQVIGNEGTGIEVLNAEGVTLAGNNCSGNTEEGIRLQCGSTAKIQDNVCEINKGSGIVLLYCNTESMITGNRVGKNAMAGIWVALGARAEIRNNVVAENFLSGIAVDYWSTNVSVYDNQCESNGKSGIAFQYGAGGSVNDNSCRKNGDYGILVKDETTDVMVGTNTLEGNATGAAVTLKGIPLSEQFNPHEEGVVWAFKAGNYDYLEMVVERLRRYSSSLGGTLLFNYYRNILESDAWYGLPCTQEKAFTARVDHWIQTRPKSPAPWILKAKANLLWMSDHRGENRLKASLNGDQNEYQRRAKSAQHELQSAEELAGHTDPELYATWILLSGSTSKMDPGPVKELLRKSIAIEPSYLQASAYYVLVNSRHWNRQCNADTLNEALEFVYHEVAASSNVDVAEVVYAQASFMNLGGFYCTEIKEGKGGNWQRIESGYRRLLSKYPDVDRFINELACAAVLFEERATAVELFDQISERIHLPTWSGKRRFFEQARKWAKDPNAEHPCELAMAKAEDEARPKRTLIKSALTILGGFSLFTLVVTLLGVPAVSLSRSAAKRKSTQPSPPDSPDVNTD